MAKSLRSKVKRKFRTIKRQKYHSRVIDSLKKNGTPDDPALKKAYAKAFLERSGAEGAAMDAEVAPREPAEGLAAAVAPADPETEDWAKRVIEKKERRRLGKRKILAEKRRRKK